MHAAWIYALVCSIIIPYQGLFAQDIETDILELSAGPSILSSISGSRAVKELTEVDRWQKLLDLKPEDMDELRGLNSGIEIDEKIKKLGANKSPKELKVLREQLIQLRLSEILDPNQQSLLRVNVLKNNYSSPLTLFQGGATLLIELGMSREQWTELKTSAFSKNDKILEMRDDMVIGVLENMSKDVSLDKSSRLWKLFGKDFRSPPRSEFDWQQIQVFHSADPKTQLMFATMLRLDDDLKISNSQMAEISKLEKRELLQVNRSSEISAELDRILSKPQRSAIVQGLQRYLLVSDVKILLSPELIKHVGFEKNEVDAVKESIIEAAKSISEFRIKKEMEVLLSELSVMPRDFQEKLKQLVRGVWE
ncbi:MAG: hypothetical protein NTY15_04350 [Planctomycetota bacterium]|nr:hypothetical protein [Planctomycetota bacterium]